MAYSGFDGIVTRSKPAVKSLRPVNKSRLYTMPGRPVTQIVVIDCFGRNFKVKLLNIIGFWLLYTDSAWEVEL
jgi:hypothetical protein